MTIKSFDEEIKASRSIIEFVTPAIKFRSSYIILLTVAFSCVIRFTQSYYVQNSMRMHAFNPGHTYFAIGVLVFVFIQTKWFGKFIIAINFTPAIWLAFALITCGMPLIFIDGSSYRRAFEIWNVRIDMSPVATICLAMFFAVLGRKIVHLKVRHIAFYSVVLVTLIVLSMMQPNLALVKCFFLMFLSFLGIFGKRRLAVEAAVLMVCLLMLTLFPLSYRAARIMSVFNPAEYKDGMAYQTWQALRAWTSSEWLRFGLKGNVTYYVPKIYSEMAFSATVQLWGKCGACLFFLFAPMQFMTVINALETCTEPKTALLAFGLTVVYFQSVYFSLLMAVGMYPPSVQLAGSGLLDAGHQVIFSLIALGLAYRVTTHQELDAALIVLPEKAISVSTGLQAAPLNYTVAFLSCLIVLFALFAVRLN